MTPEEFVETTLPPDMMTTAPGLEYAGLFLGIIALLVVVDIGLKAWAMWRAARLYKKWWFIALLLVNSAGILPGIFLLLTKKEYAVTLGVKKV